jgi:hypothetical protein
VRKLQSFLGLVNFSLHFIPNLAAVTQLLPQLLAKEATFVWTLECQKSFAELKALVQNVFVLAHPDLAGPFKLQTYASNQGLGAVLLQQDCRREW